MFVSLPVVLVADAYAALRFLPKEENAENEELSMGVVLNASAILISEELLAATPPLLASLQGAKLLLNL